MNDTRFKNYVKTAVQPMRPYVPGEDLTGITVSEKDTPELGGMIGVNPNNENDQWYVSKLFFLGAKYVESSSNGDATTDFTGGDGPVKPGGGGS